jgi:hypothetical protein
MPRQAGSCLSCQTLCMKGNSGMASGSRSGNSVALQVVLRRLFRCAASSVGVASLKRTGRAAAGSAKARAGATAAVSCTTRRSSGRAYGAPLS